MSAVRPRVIFSSSQEMRLFPQPGNHENAPHLGPGCYDNHKIGTIIYELEKKPESRRGYGLSARTAARFPPCTQAVTPSPQQYQQDHSKSRVTPPGKTPFSSSTQRFRSPRHTAATTPGPGTYDHDVETNKKVSWPMRFGSPDWSRLAQLEKSVQVKLTSDKQRVKQRSRLAYLSLYFYG